MWPFGLTGHSAGAAQGRKRKAPEEPEGKARRRVLPRAASAARSKRAGPKQRSAPFRRLSGLGWRKRARTAQRPVGRRREEGRALETAQSRRTRAQSFRSSPAGGGSARAPRNAPLAAEELTHRAGHFGGQRGFAPCVSFFRANGALHRARASSATGGDGRKRGARIRRLRAGRARIFHGLAHQRGPRCATLGSGRDLGCFLRDRQALRPVCKW